MPCWKMISTAKVVVMLKGVVVFLSYKTQCLVELDGNRCLLEFTREDVMFRNNTAAGGGGTLRRPGTYSSNSSERLRCPTREA
jgi:hypothetical protein